MPYAQLTPLLDSIALEAKFLSGFGEKEVPRTHAQGFLWSHLSQNAEFTSSELESTSATNNVQKLEQKQEQTNSNLAVPWPAPQVANLSPYDIGHAPIDRSECYTLEQKNALLDHVAKYYGQSHVVIPSQAITFYDTFLQGETTPQIQFEVRCVPAHLNQRYYDLYFTVGLGAYRMAVPVDDREGRPAELERVELMLRLPPFFGDDNLRDFANHSPNGGWPLLLLRSLALKILHSHQFAYQQYRRHTLPVPYVSTYQSYQSAPCLAPWSQMSGCMLLEPQDFNVLANICKLPQSTHEVVRFIGVLPLYAEEMAFKHNIDMQGKSGGRALLRKLTESGFEPWLSSLDRPHYLQD